jgi:hypothetical protein
VKKEDGVEFGVLRWGGGMEDVLGRFIQSVNCGVAWRALDDKLRRIDERAAACGDLKLQEKMTLKLRTEGAPGRSPSCAVAPIIMEMDDGKKFQNTNSGACPGIRCSSRALAQVLVYGVPAGSPSAGHDPLCLRLFGLSRPGLPQVLFCRRLYLVEMSLLLRDMR